jgi:DNA-binding transcriptional ArsR family regulator
VRRKATTEQPPPFYTETAGCMYQEQLPSGRMARPRDPETGQFKTRHSRKEFLQLLRDTRLSTAEIRDQLGYHRTTVYEKLRRFEDEGLVRSTEVGNTLIWERIEE